ncbi:hypothetical protein MUK42_23660 [Musa troglodytarum]|uniref:Uncharacterized protein n=1 Tax=Musa troglodytarum TaxID=320322 RepID=A0A9E7FGE0_9LILI|nr:hypothetical protein MUK42_23660 [Musa troglodytarum]
MAATSRPLSLRTLPRTIPPLSHPSCRGFCPRWSGRSSWLMRNASEIFIVWGVADIAQMLMQSNPWPNGKMDVAGRTVGTLLCLASFSNVLKFICFNHSSCRFDELGSQKNLSIEKTWVNSPSDKVQLID